MKLIIDSEEILNDINIIRNRVESICDTKFEWKYTTVDTLNLISIVTDVSDDYCNVILKSNIEDIYRDSYNVIIDIDKSVDCNTVQISVYLETESLVDHIKESYHNPYDKS